MEEQTEIKPRKPLIAFFLAFIPGLGQIYNGQLKKGILFLALIYFNLFFWGVTRLDTHFYGLVTLLVISIFLQIFMIADAVINAKRQKNYIPNKYNTWYYHLLFAVVLICILNVFNPRMILGIRAFSKPTSAGEPNMLVGDLFMVDLNAYKNEPVNYGDIVVFIRDSDKAIFSYRVVGLPNDKIDLNEDIVSINGKPSKSMFIKDTVAPDEGFSVSEFSEELPNGKKYMIYKHMQDLIENKVNIKNINVPADNYFLLGDNRDNAADSRYIGFIKRKNIIGRVCYCYWGRSIDRINIDFLNE